MGFNPVLPDGLLPEGDVEGMKEFLSMLIRPKLGNYVYLQWHIGVGFEVVLGLLSLVIVAQRLFTRSVWLLQFYSTPRGVFIIPNAVITFAIFIFLYTFLYISYIFINIEYHQHGLYSKAYFLMRGMPWMSLWIGCWLSTAGTMSAFPDALSLRGRNIGPVQQFLLQPALFNTVLFSVPVISTSTVYLPMIIGLRIFNKMLDRYKEWLVKAADPAADVAALAVEAKSIWLDVTRAYYYDSITYALYVAWDVFLLVFFFAVASHMLLRVRAQVELAKRKKQALAATQQTFYLFSSRPSYGQAHKQHIAKPAAPGVQRSPQIIGVEPSTSTSSVLFPALKIQPGEKLTKAEAVARRSKALKLVYQSLLIQYTAIGLGIISFIGLAALVALTSYDAARTNRLKKFVEPHYLINCYINICYGCGIVGSVAWRTFDKAFVLGGDTDEAEEVAIPIPVASPDDSKDKTRRSYYDASEVPFELQPTLSSAVYSPQDVQIIGPSPPDRLPSKLTEFRVESEIMPRFQHDSTANMDSDLEATLPLKALSLSYDSATAVTRLGEMASSASQPSRFGAWRTSQS